MTKKHPWLQKKWYVVCYKKRDEPRGETRTKVIEASHSGKATDAAREIVLEKHGWDPEFIKIRPAVPGERSCAECSECIRRGDVCPKCR